MHITVIIPVYNAAAYLEDALKSALAQRGVAVEVIAVDDGSDDGSGELLDRLAAAEPRLKVLHQPNSGQGAARNAALALATGEAVYFMDADDELAADDALSRLAAAMREGRLDVLFFDAMTRVDAGLQVSESVLRAGDYIRTNRYEGVYSGRELFAAFLRHREFTVSPCLMLLRRGFLVAERLAFPSERIFYEDNIFMTRVLLAAKRAGHRPWQLYVRKVHAGSTVTSAPTLRHLRGYLACYRDADALLAHGGWDAATRRALADRRRIYKLHVRRLIDSNGELRSAARRELPPAELAELRAALRYPIGEKAVNALHCLRDRGLTYTLRRIVGGRQ